MTTTRTILLVDGPGDGLDTELSVGSFGSYTYHGTEYRQRRDLVPGMYTCDKTKWPKVGGEAW